MADLPEAGSDPEDTGITPRGVVRLRNQPRTDVQTNAIIDIGLPPDWLLVKRFPANKDVVRFFSGQDLLEFGLKMQCGS